MVNTKDKEGGKETKPVDEGTEDGTSVLNVEGVPSASRSTGADESPPKTPMMERIPKKDNTEKKKLTAAERRKLAELKRREKEDKKRKEKPETSTDDESNEALKKKIKFYQDKAEAAESEAYEAKTEKEKQEKMYQNKLAKRKNETSVLKEQLKEKMKENEKKKEDDDSEDEDDSLSDPLESDDSESSETESSPEKPKKGKKNGEVTEADRRNSKVCAFDPCERQEHCGFVHIKSGSVSSNYNNSYI